MSNYYAVQRSSRSLKHYGVPGMKWGIRKEYDDEDQRSSSNHSAAYNGALYKIKKNMAAQAKGQKDAITSATDYVIKQLTAQARNQQDQLYELREQMAGIPQEQRGAFDRMFDEANGAFDDAQKKLAKGKLPNQQQMALLKRYTEMIQSVQSQLNATQNKIRNAVNSTQRRKSK